MRVLQAIPGETFEFESVVLDELEQYVGPGDIQSIVVDEDLGEVTVTLVGHDGHEFGADNVGEINLWTDGTTGTLGALTISGDFGAVGPLWAPFAGDIHIGGSTVNELAFESVGDVSIDGALGGPLYAVSAADVTLGSAENASLFVDGPYSGTITSAGSIRSIRCDGQFSGQVFCGGDLGAPLYTGLYAANGGAVPMATAAALGRAACGVGVGMSPSLGGGSGFTYRRNCDGDESSSCFIGGQRSMRALRGKPDPRMGRSASEGPFRCPCQVAPGPAWLSKRPFYRPLVARWRWAVSGRSGSGGEEFFMIRLLLVVLSFGAVVCEAEPYWVSWQSGWPEEQGWTWGATDPAPQRWLDDGTLYLDSRAGIGRAGGYYQTRPGMFSPEPGETFIMQWRVKVWEAAFSDPGVILESDDHYMTSFTFSANRVYSDFEPGHSAPFAAGQFHEFRLESDDFRGYDLYLDGAIALQGTFLHASTLPSTVSLGRSLNGNEPQPVGLCGIRNSARALGNGVHFREFLPLVAAETFGGPAAAVSVTGGIVMRTRVVAILLAGSAACAVPVEHQVRGGMLREQGAVPMSIAGRASAAVGVGMSLPPPACRGLAPFALRALRLG